MTEGKNTENYETLGEFLVRQREEKNLGFDDIQRETKIPPKSLQAIEEDDYGELPAEVFTRGFYSLYAKCLNLDPTEILNRYDIEFTENPDKRRFALPSKQEKQVNTMAARPSTATGSALGFSLILLIVIIAILCWAFSWNPATFLSERLRSFQKPTTSEMQMQGENTSSTQESRQQKGDIESKYFLTAAFLEDTTVTVAIDDGLPEKEAYSEGSSISWYANETISLILPEAARVDLFFNGMKMELPQAKDGFISLNLP